MSPYPVGAIALGAALAAVVATLIAALIAYAGFPLPASGRRVGCVDGLRGYLALAVLIHHFIIWLQVTRLGGTWAAPSINAFNQLGAGGVAFFFMITGFVFYPRVLAGFRACSWPAIYVARVLRIVALIAVSVGIIILVICLRGGAHLHDDFPKAALQWIVAWGEPPLLDYPDSGRLNAYVLWSLWYEWLFYLFVLPACALARDALRNRAPSWIVPAALLSGSIIARAAGLTTSLLPFLPLFAIGMLAYEIQQRKTLAQKLCTPTASVLAAAALVLGLMIAPTPYGLAMPLFGFFLLCIACGNDFGGLLRSKAALVLGECSFGIYLLHGIVLDVIFTDGTILLHRFTTEYISIFIPVSALLTTSITPLTFLFVERPAMRSGSRLVKYMADRRLLANA